MTAAYRWRGLPDAELEALRARERVVSPAEQERRERIAARRGGRPAPNRGRSLVCFRGEHGACGGGLVRGGGRCVCQCHAARVRELAP